MGLIHKFALENYWNMKDLIQETPSFHHIISHVQFLKILEFLHVLTGKVIKSHFKNIVIDERICSFQGKIALKQYCGYHILPCAKTSYIYKTVPYAGKKDTGNCDLIVKTLLKGLEKKGYYIFMDNYFTMLKLLFELQELGFAMTETIRQSRKEMPLTDKKK